MTKLGTTVFLTASLAVSSFAETHKVPEEKPVATVSIPDDWKTNAFDDGVEATSEDGEVYLAIEKANAKGVSDSMDEALKYLKDKGVKVDTETMKQSEGKLAGMDVVDIDFKGKDDDGDANISLMIISVSSDKGLLLTYWASPEGEKKHQSELNEITQSIARAK